MALTAPAPPEVAEPAAPRRLVGVAMIVGSAVLFAGNGIAAKTILASGHVDATRLVSLRTLFAAIILVALLTVFSPRELRPGRPALIRLALLGVVGIGLLQWAYFNHLQRLPVAVGMTIQYLAPVAVTVLARFVFGEAVRRRVWPALALTLAGIALVMGVAQGVSLRLDPVGVLFAFCAMASLTVYYLLGERSVSATSPLATQTWMVVVGALMWQILLPIWTFDLALLGAPVALPGAAGAAIPLWVPLAYLVLGGTVVAHLLVLASLRRIGAPLVGLLGMAEPVLVALLGWALLSEALTGWQVAGVCIAVSGMMLAASSRRRGVRASAAAPDEPAPRDSVDPDASRA